MTRIVIAPNGSQVATSGDDNSVKLWNIETGALIRTFNGHSDTVMGLAFSPDGLVLVSGSDHKDKRLVIWDLLTGAALQTIELEGAVRDLLFAADGKQLYAGGSEVAVINVAPAMSPVEPAYLSDDLYDITAMAWALDGSLVSADEDGNIHSSSMPSGRIIDSQSVHQTEVVDLAMSANGILISADMDGVVVFWDWRSRTQLFQGDEHDQWSVNGVAISADGKIAASTSHDELVVWDVASQRVMNRFKISSYVGGVALAPDGSYLLVEKAGGLERISLTDDGRMALTPTLNADSAQAILWDDEMSTLYGGTETGQLVSWNVAQNAVATSSAGRGPITSMLQAQSILAASLDLTVTGSGQGQAQAAAETLTDYSEQAEELVAAVDSGAPYVVSTRGISRVNLAKARLEPLPWTIGSRGWVRYASISESAGLAYVAFENSEVIYDLATGEQLHEKKPFFNEEKVRA